MNTTLNSETTAAATDKVGVLRRDPMAMQPFCGYNFGDYFGHWLDVGKKLSNPPKIFRVNWFRTDLQGRFLWPGFSDNLRVIAWILGRCEGRGEAEMTAIGLVPTLGAIDIDGLKITDDQMRALLHVDAHEWHEAIGLQAEYFEKLGEHTPAGMWHQHANLVRRVTGLS